MDQSRSESDLAAIYDAMACGVVVRNAAGAVVFANAAAKRIFGRPPDELEGGEAPGDDRRVREDGTVMPDDEVPNVAAQARGEPIRNVMMGMVRADGYVRWLLVDAVPIKDGSGRVREVVSSFTDVTDRKKAEHELERQALHDTLTGLPNRSLLLDRLEQALRTARRLATPLALLVMDLDRFKEINDTFGHRAGDLLIGEVAERIMADLRDTDTVARLGGDEFALILPGADEGGAGHVAQKIIAALQRPFDIEGTAHEVAISIGIAVSPQHGEDVETLMRRADIAMYVAKTTPGGSAVYAEQQDREGSNQLALMAELRHTLDTHQLQVVYQPIVSFTEGQVTSFEALARWRHPERGLIAPAEFIPLAERSGLVQSLFAQVLGVTLAQCAAWKQASLPLQAAVNLSIRNLLDPDLPRVVAEALERAAVPPAWLAFEITESMLMAEPNRVLRTLAELRDIGVQFAIDDFGVGYSSLAYLQRLPAYAVKIDRSFVSRMTRHRGSAEIVKLITNLGHALGMKVVAEGIEDQATYDACAAVGCDSAQGFFVGRPMVSAAIPAWLAQGHRTITIT
ncbi:MAG TPA: EAL domain-containing protein [Candidatus Limnocylindria bacterium]|nr:EAL domain-containing protein [Candidatus Limnocylindria bacterium]